jgi:hypothetical protein
MDAGWNEQAALTFSCLTARIDNQRTLSFIKERTLVLNVAHEPRMHRRSGDGLHCDLRQTHTSHDFRLKPQS